MVLRSIHPKNDTKLRLDFYQLLYKQKLYNKMLEAFDETSPIYKSSKTFFLKRKLNPKFAHSDYTSIHKPPSKDGSWIQTYRRLTKTAGDECAFQDCKKKGEVGAHVRYTGSIELYASWYIIPACRRCNAKHGLCSYIKKGTVLLKVIKGNILTANKILVGRLGDKFPNKIDKASKQSWMFIKSFKSWEKSDKEIVKIRRWPKIRLGGWGWK